VRNEHQYPLSTDLVYDLVPGESPGSEKEKLCDEGFDYLSLEPNTP